MYGLHQTLTRPREDGLSWKIMTDYRTGEWLPTLIVTDLDKAMKHHPQMILEALNGTSVAIKSNAYARMFLRDKFAGNLLDEILKRVTGDTAHA